MKMRTCPWIVFTGLITGLIAGIIVSPIPAHAQLPHIESGEWRGYHALHEAQRYTFTIRNDGEMTLIPTRRSRQEVAKAKRIKLEYGIEELRPDGTTVFKQARRESLESEQDAGKKIDKVVFRGTTTGNAVFEVVVEESRDIISIGGRVVDVGDLTEHPLRFTVRAHLPNVYEGVSIEDRDDEKAFDRRTRGDYMELVRLDRSKVSLDHDDCEDAKPDELTGSGIEEIEMRLSYYERRFFFTAGRNSGIALSNIRRPGPWYEGMTLHWATDTHRDPQHRARLRLWIK